MKEIPGLQYSSPNTFTTRQRLVLTIVPPLVSTVLKVLVASSRKEVRGLEHWRAVIESHGRVIIAIWHESMGLAACYCRNTGYHTLTSYSFDGEMAARVVRHFGLFAVRGSSSRGGSEAIRSLSAALEHLEAVGFTVDGPRGPRRVAKPGVAVLAARTQIPIIPFALTVAPSWRLNSWDRLPIPKPFSRMICAFGPAIDPPEDDCEDKVDKVRVQTETGLNVLYADLEQELGIVT